jgi:hypothetical protein
VLPRKKPPLTAKKPSGFSNAVRRISAERRRDWCRILKESAGYDERLFLKKNIFVFSKGYFQLHGEVPSGKKGAFPLCETTQEDFGMAGKRGSLGSV